MIKHLLISAAFFCLVINYCTYGQLVHPYNLDFENGALNSIPVGWSVNLNSSREGFAAVTTNENPLKGRYCMGVFNPQNTEDMKSFRVVQTINANVFAGRKVKLRAAVRFEKLTPGSGAYLWLKVKFEGVEEGIFISTHKGQIEGNAWKYYEIEGRIDDYARFIDFGLSTNGWCNAWVDDISIEISDSVSNYVNKKPSPISGEAIGNITTFAKLFGFVRYFYPSFESLKTDWEKFAYLGAEYFEKTVSVKELEKGLNEFFLPVAPGIEIYSSTRKPSKKLITAFPDKSLKNVALINKYEGSRDLLNPDRLPFNVFVTTRESEGSVYQLINAAPYAGKKMRLSCMARVEQENPSGQAQIIIQMEKKFQKHAKREFLPDLTITGRVWKKYSVEMVIPEDYDFIVLQLALIGEGKAYFDKVEFGDSAGGENHCKNQSFELERDDNLTYGWKSNPVSVKGQYNYKVVKTNPFEGSQCLMIESDSSGRIRIPSIGDVLSTGIGSGLMLRMPRVLFVDSVQTLPYSKDLKPITGLADSSAIQYNLEDKTSRLATVIIAWNIFRHFSLSDSDDIVWDEVLRKCLEKAAIDSTDEDFIETLNLLAAISQDPQSRFWLAGKEYKNALPFLLKWIAGKLYVSRVSEGKGLKIKPGSEILEIDGVSVNDLLNLKSRFIAGNDAWKKLRLAAIIRAGESSGKVEIKYRLPNNEVEVNSFAKDIFIDELTEPKLEQVSFYDPSGRLGDSLPGGFYYIDLTRVSEEEIENGAGELAFAEGIVFDLRGIANVPYTFLGYFSKDTLDTFDWCLPVFTSPGREYLSYRSDYRRIPPKATQLKPNIIFLCDEKTTGNSEAILNLARKYNLGRIAGSPTGGSPGVTTAFVLPGGISFSMAEVTIRDRITKKTIGKPVIPDIVINPAIEGINKQEDDLVKKAFELLK